MTFIEYWENYKKQFQYGIDYIQVDCDDYIAIIPANFNVVHDMGFLAHCFAYSFDSFAIFVNAYYFNSKRKLKGIKVLAFKKDSTIEELQEMSGTLPKNKEIEFTFWCNQKNSDKRLYGLHSHRNNGEISQYMLFEDVKFEPKKEYKYYHNIAKPYLNKIREEFSKHKFELLKTSFNNIRNRIINDEWCWTGPSKSLLYIEGFDNFLKNNKI